LSTLTLSTNRITVGAGQTANFTASMSVTSFAGIVLPGVTEGHIYVRSGGVLHARLPFALTNQNAVSLP